MIYPVGVNPKKPASQRRKNAGLSLHPALVALLEKHRGRQSKSQYAEEIIRAYFRARRGKLSADEKAVVERESL